MAECIAQGVIASARGFTRGLTGIWAPVTVGIDSNIGTVTGDRSTLTKANRCDRHSCGGGFTVISILFSVTPTDWSVNIRANRRDRFTGSGITAGGRLAIGTGLTIAIGCTPGTARGRFTCTCARVAEVVLCTRVSVVACGTVGCCSDYTCPCFTDCDLTWACLQLAF